MEHRRLELLTPTLPVMTDCLFYFHPVQKTLIFQCFLALLVPSVIINYYRR